LADAAGEQDTANEADRACHNDAQLFVEPGRTDALERRFQDSIQHRVEQPLFATAAVGFVFFLAGAILLGIAIARVGQPMKWIGIGFAATLVLFVLGFLFLEIAQPIGGALFALVAVMLALRLPNYTLPMWSSS
jgi:hypothetical protein